MRSYWYEVDIVVHDIGGKPLSKPMMALCSDPYMCHKDKISRVASITAQLRIYIYFMKNNAFHVPNAKFDETQ